MRRRPPGAGSSPTTRSEASSFAAAYSDAVDVWLAELLGDPARRRAARGRGLGRRELCPASDLDLVLVHDGKRGRDLGEIADAVWYPIWDSGVALDHSVRTPKEARAVADRDLKAALGLLDGRVVAGDAVLGERLLTRIRADWRDRARNRLPSSGTWSSERHRSSGDVAFALEPDLKEGQGGSRDVATLAPWRACRRRVRARRAAGRRGRHAARRARRAAAPGRPDRPAAARAPGRRRRRARARRRRRADGAGERGGAHHRLAVRRRVARGAVVAPRTPRALGRRARRARCRPGSCSATARSRWSPTRRRPTTPRSCSGPPPTPPTWGCRSRARRSAASTPSRGTVHDPWAPETREAFVALLGGGDAAVPQLEMLDQHGLLVQFLPEWDVVRSLPQRNAFHRYTVDRHLLEAVARVADLVRRVRRPDLLLVGTLLHDLGKGRPGDHTDNGVVLAERVATRMGFDPADVAVLVDLVRCTCSSRAGHRARPRRSRHHRRGRRRGRHRGHARSARRAHRGRLARDRPDRVVAWKAGLVVRLVSLARSELRRRAGFAVRRAAGARRARPAAGHVRRVAHRRPAPRRGDHPGARRAGPARGRGGRAGRARPGRAPGAHLHRRRRRGRRVRGGARARPRNPTGTAFAVDLRAALRRPDRGPGAARGPPPALRLVLPADRGAPRRAPGVRRQRRHRRRHHRRGPGRRRHRRPVPDHRRVRPRSACGSTRPSCRPSGTRWSTPST